MRRILTGIRPTGPLHLGHYIGALKQWIELQDDYECYFLIADVQALTTHEKNPKLIRQAIKDVVLDWVAVGLDPFKPNVHFVLQSAIPELTELTTYLSMVTPFSWMESNPTIQAEKKRIKKVSTGFMYYVVSQAADVLFVSPDPKSTRRKILVPVGEDQVPHLRDTNNIAKRFNRTYGKTFVECTALVGDVGRLVGTDGQEKMSKSLNNAIHLRDDEKTVRDLVMKMYTDPKRIGADIPGTVEGNPVFVYHNAFNPDGDAVRNLEGRYRAGTVGDVEVKQKLYAALVEFLKPIWAKRKQAEKSLDVHDVLEDGTLHARRLAIQTLERTRDNIKLMKL